MLPDLETTDNTNDFACYRMLPPGTHKYFYTIANKLVVATDQPSKINEPFKLLPKLPKETLKIIRKE